MEKKAWITKLSLKHYFINIMCSIYIKKVQTHLVPDIKQHNENMI